ncbi:nucleotide exchange factor GrpE [Actinomadura sp. WMMB 499]|uniref:nucleotide exchange factor GrpE n=1 Tax=Actinomadura sp. WMMB 499 TaxID=1219491 RepID=UPI0012441C6E|nr:nucleotide exchange factor GrpE [Actinomadura sp. WMMB 499]QFG22713.1 nucleotide exchange factor GrpE [Actinomadura sp. WMMB 499]
MVSASPDEGEEKEGPVIRDRRRIDPETGKVREQAGEKDAPAAPAAPAGEAAGTAGGAGDGEATALQEQLAERLDDLRRLKAEYDNYRKRVERDRVAVREQALGQVLSELLPVLDDIGRARDHDELTGGFKSVGEALESVTGKLGLETYGEKGEPFDPTVHEALMHGYSADVTETSVADVLQPGYRIGERILRPARVAVAEPDPNADGAAAAAGDETAEAAAADEADESGKSANKPDDSGKSDD